MKEQEPTSTGGLTGNETISDEQAEHPEQPTTPPRIYVASLTDYNNGQLLGEWIDANQEPGDIRRQIDDLLARSRYPNAEEWAIHDFEGFGGFAPHEYEDLAVISRVGTSIAEHGRAFAAYLAWAGTSEEAVADFENHYMGRWDSREAWARDAGEDFGWQHQIEQRLDPNLSPYVRIDYAAFARDMASDWHLIDGPDGVYVFAP